MNTALPSHPLWDFSLHHYGQPKIKAACLALQDQYGLNVNVVLLCCWHKQPFNKQALSNALFGIQAWHTRITQRLRRLRYQVSHQTSQTYQNIKTLELMAEYTEQALLATDFPAVNLSTQALSPALDNLKLYLQLQNIDYTQEIATLFEPLLC
jgi:uncharacterized protein (TIGR02444 family)